MFRVSLQPLQRRLARRRPSFFKFQVYSRNYSSSEQPTITKPDDVKLQRAIRITDISSPAKVSQLLNKNPYGPLEYIKYNPDDKSAVFQFIRERDALVFEEDYPHGQFVEASRLSADIVAAVGSHYATRCVALHRPTGAGSTTKSLREDLKKFGPIEKLEIRTDFSTRRMRAKAHFWDIADAFKAFTAFNTPNNRVVFLTERTDEVLMRLQAERHERDSEDAKIRARAGETDSLKTVIIDDLPHKPTYTEIMNTIENAVDWGGRDVVYDINITPGDSVFINFWLESDAEDFDMAINERIPKLLEGGGIVKLQPKGLDVSQEVAQRARELGAGRTLSLKLKLRPWGNTGVGELRVAFSRWKDAVLDIKVVDDRAYVSFTNIHASMKALLHGTRDPLVKELIEEIGFTSTRSSPVRIGDALPELED